MWPSLSAKACLVCPRAQAHVVCGVLLAGSGARITPLSACGPWLEEGALHLRHPRGLGLEVALLRSTRAGPRSEAYVGASLGTFERPGLRRAWFAVEPAGPGSFDTPRGG